MASKFKCIGSAMLLDFSYLYIQVITPSVIGLIDPGEWLKIASFKNHPGLSNTYIFAE